MGILLWTGHRHSGGFPGGSVARNPPANAGDTGDTLSIPGLGRSLRKGDGNPLPYSCLRNPWTEEPGGLQSMGHKRVGHGCTHVLMRARTHTHTHTHTDTHSLFSSLPLLHRGEDF